MNFNENIGKFRKRAISFTVDSDSKAPLLAVRLISLVLMVSLLTMHLRSLRVFRWEHSVTGGITITYFVATIGLTLCAGTSNCGGTAFQAYLSSTGAVLVALNAAAIWRRWKKAGELTRVVAEFLSVLGVQLRRQVRTKVFLSVAAAISFLLDLIFTSVITSKIASNSKDQVLYKVVFDSFDTKVDRAV